MLNDLKPYPRTIPGPATWLPRIPSHWVVTHGSGVLALARERNSDLAEQTVLSLSYGRVVVKPRQALRGLVPDSFETYQVLRPGDIVIRPTDLQNDQTSLRVGHVQDHGIITSAYLGFRPRGVESGYAFLYLAALDYMKVFYGMGSGLRQQLGIEDFKRLPMLLPPNDEQAAIVKYLAHAHARIDRAIAAKRKLIALLEEEKQAIISQAVTRGLDPTVPMKASGVAWPGEIPSHWEVRAMKRCLQILIDCKHKTAPTEAGTEFLVARTSAIKQGRLVLAGTYTTSLEGYKEWTGRGVPQPGDVIFTREAPAGEACVVPSEVKVCLGQRTVLMRPLAARISPHWLVHSIYQGSARREILVATQGSTVGHFNMDDIERLRVCLPPRDEQDEIVGFIEATLRPLDVAIMKARTEIELLREFRARLTSDVVSGQVDVRDIAATLPEFVEPSEPDVDSVNDDFMEDLDEAIEEVDA